MFKNWFLNTRATVDHLHKQLSLLGRIISLSTQVLFIGYYIYLIIINIERIYFLIVCAALLTLSLVSLIFDIYFMEKKVETRLAKRLTVEKKRKYNNVLLVIRVLLKLAAIVLSGIELVKYSGSEMQIITFTLSIIVFVFYLIFNSLIFIINKDLDLIRLSIEADITSSKIITKLLNLEKKEYTEKEKQIIQEIDARTKEYIENEDNK